MRINGAVFNKKILIIDHHQRMRETIRWFLEHHFDDLIIKEADSALEGINKAKRVKPDLGLIDFGLPIINGVETAIRIKDTWPELPIIIMSVYKQDLLKQDMRLKNIIFMNKNDIDKVLIGHIYAMLNK